MECKIGESTTFYKTQFVQLLFYRGSNIVICAFGKPRRAFSTLYGGWIVQPTVSMVPIKVNARFFFCIYLL